MTESEWLECTDPFRLLASLRGRVSDRKLRLLACGCARRCWDRLDDDRLRTAVEIAEQYADRRASVARLEAAWRAAEKCQTDYLTSEVYRRSDADQAYLYGIAASSASPRRRRHGRGDAAGAGLHFIPAQALIYVLCLFGNPFRLVSIEPALLTPTVTNLAQAAYEERIMPSGELDAARLAVLSDALEEAACDNADILAHLRSPGPHVRGCWVLDLLLGKE
jgi:hypothetical protein